MARTTGKGSNVLSLKVTLRNVRPPVWRRLLMPDGMTLADLHAAIQAAMGWHGGHLHAFEVDGQDYGDPFELENEAADEARLTLGALVKSGVSRFVYLYDFGDGWEHLVAVEPRKPGVEGRAAPACIAGRRACPPEDCGGPWGYAALLAALADPGHPEHAELREWVDEDFDPGAFSVAEADAALVARFGKRRQSV